MSNFKLYIPGVGLCEVVNKPIECIEIKLRINSLYGLKTWLIPETIKIPEENIVSKLLDIGLGDVFFKHYTKSKGK